MYAPSSGSWVDNQLEWVVFRKRGPFHRCFWSIGFAFPLSLRDVNRVLRGRGGGGGRSPLCDKQLLFVRGSSPCLLPLAESGVLVMVEPPRRSVKCAVKR